jgi:alpha-tubulin suppressor-like RCC1 family protein
MRGTRIGALCASALIALGALGAGTASAAGHPAAGWGGNEYGQLATGTPSEEQRVPIQTNFGGEVVQIATSGEHTLALMSDGTVKAVGANSFGQLGDGTTTNRAEPVSVKELKEVVAIAAGEGYSLAVLGTGHVMAWGENSVGQLGDGSTSNSSVPVEVTGLSNAAGVSAAPRHALAVLASGAVEAWGANDSGDLGDGSYSEGSTVPVAVSELSEAVEVSGGSELSLARLSSGKVATWGTNQQGTLGTGERAGPHACTRSVGTSEPVTEEYGCSDVPVTVPGLSEVSGVSGGYNFVLAALAGGSVKAWGSNNIGQLGLEELGGPTKCSHYRAKRSGAEIVWEACSESPVAVHSVAGATAVAAGDVHGLALLSGGAVKSWGSNFKGELGLELRSSIIGWSTPTTVPGVGEVASIAAGGVDSFSLGTELPVVTSLSPGSGPVAGGTSVVITGRGFTGVTSVNFGNAAATGVTVESPTRITAISPAHRLAVVDVRVLTSHGITAKSSGDEFSYAPEALDIGRCTNVGTGVGHYKNSFCSEALAGGKYEWSSGVAKPGIAIADGTETSESVEKPRKVVFETTGKTQLVCANVTGSAEFHGSTAITAAVMRFTGCELSGSKCASNEAAEGEVVTNTLGGTLGWREKLANNVGLAWAPLSEEAPWFEATCGATTVKVTGSAVGAIVPVDNMSPTLTVRLKETKGKQSVERFEGEGAARELRMSINGGLSIQTGLSLETIQTSEEQVEINTVL